MGYPTFSVFFFNILKWMFLDVKILPSPTTGTFSPQSFNWRGNSSNYQQGIKEEEMSCSNFSFEPNKMPASAALSMFQSSSAATTVVVYFWISMPAASFSLFLMMIWLEHNWRTSNHFLVFSVSVWSYFSMTWKYDLVSINRKDLLKEKSSLGIIKNPQMQLNSQPQRTIPRLTTLLELKPFLLLSFQQ